MIDKILTTNTINYEIIIVEDNSPDKTIDSVKEMQKLYGIEKIKILERPGKLGLGTAYMDGCKLCTGDFIFIMDADFSHHPKFLIDFIKKQKETNADIVTGISLMLLFLGLGLRLGYDTILLAHIVINLPYAMLCILPQVLSMDRVCYEAALDLGATPLQAFRKVILPELRPGIMAAFLLSFAMSADDFIVNIYGGKVHASAGTEAAGIGGGNKVSGGTIRAWNNS